jgi:hypothetical protein
LIGLTHLEILDLKSNENESIQIEANSFDSFSSCLHRLYLEMRNISLENIYNIRNSFKPKMVKKYSRWEYFLPVHIENRVDIECSRTLLFMRSKLLYNFLNEYIDVDDFLMNCMNLTKLRNDLNSLEKSLSHINSIQLESYSKHVNEPDDKIYAYYILACVVIALIYFLWKCFIKHKTELIKSIENNFINLRLQKINQEMINIRIESVENKLIQTNKKLRSKISDKQLEKNKIEFGIKQINTKLLNFYKSEASNN